MLEIVSEDALIPVAAGEPIHLSFTGKVVWKMEFEQAVGSGYETSDMFEDVERANRSLGLGS